MIRWWNFGSNNIQGDTVKSFGNDRKGGASTALNTRNILSVGHTLLELAIRRIRRAMYGKNMPKPREVFPS